MDEKRRRKTEVFLLPPRCESYCRQFTAVWRLRSAMCLCSFLFFSPPTILFTLWCFSSTGYKKRSPVSLFWFFLPGAWQWYFRLSTMTPTNRSSECFSTLGPIFLFVTRLSILRSSRFLRPFFNREIALENIHCSSKTLGIRRIVSRINEDHRETTRTR